MKIEVKILSLLKESGAELVRKKRHEVWKLPNGKIFVRSITPSDKKAILHNLCDLRTQLGMQNQEKKPAASHVKIKKPLVKQVTTKVTFDAVSLIPESKSMYMQLKSNSTVKGIYERDDDKYWESFVKQNNIKKIK